MNVRLGKLAPLHDSRTLKMARYTVSLPDPPPACNLTGKVTSLGMMLNDTLGDCTCATIGHMVQTWTAECGAEVILPDEAILEAYEAFCGYDPKDPSTDEGGIELDVLNGWRKLGVAGHTIAAYVALQIQPSQSLQAAMPSSMWRKLEEQFEGFFGKKKATPRAMLPELARQLKQGVYFFGGVYIGVELPKTAQEQETWDVVSVDGDGAPGSWGGHAIPIVGYDEEFFYVITWGKVLKVTPAFLAEYLSEAYICVSHDMVGPNGKSPAGLDVPTLLTDLAEVTA